MIDPLLSLSFNLHAQHGTYALLIGSGVSRAANIPTGWEVTLDLIAKLAHLENEDCEGDEARWYAEKYGTDPDYSELLSSLASTSAAQQQLLKAYFEPTSDERELGEKVPTEAHKAIAKLVGNGHIRVIITTNFDRLLEAALEADGIAPVVVASPDAAKGAPPFMHSKCTVIKVHGDYLDHRIKNSPEALSKYHYAMDRLLNRTFDEHGLIICGWSAEYDVALRKAIERSKTRRYPMYWTGLSKPRGPAKELIALHSAHFLKIEGADAFFGSLVGKVEALEEFNRPHPVSTQAAVVTLKRYLSEDRYRIQLRDFLVAEASQTGSAIDSAWTHVKEAVPDQANVPDLMKGLEAACERLLHVFANGTFYAGKEQAKPFFDAFNLIVAKAQSPEHYDVWVNLGRYPTLLLVYTAGVAAIASGNFVVLKELTSRPSYLRRHSNRKVVAPDRIYTSNVMEAGHANVLIVEGETKKQTPLSDYLFGRLRAPLSELLPNDAQYQEAFVDFEYLWCLLHVDAQLQRNADHAYPIDGQFIWRWGTFSSRGYDDRGDRLIDVLQNVIESKDATWPILKAGMFGGDLQRLRAAHEFSVEPLQELARYLRRP